MAEHVEMEFRRSSRKKRCLIHVAMMAVGGLAVWCPYEWLWLPPLAAGLAQDELDPTHDSAFNRRVVAKFSTGSPEQALVAELRQEGFEAGVGLYRRST
jgi:hypothetical protein